ncbi:MAG: hypothetical protein E7628_05085 [Ruminococcaceae bacterium]|nr:hypothetical protein [Oscillospiraceae bacterium]
MKNTDNRNNGEEKLSLVPGTKPFTVYKFIELGVCLVAVLVGVLYLYAKIIPLTVLFPAFAICFAAIPVLRFLDIKKRGGKGFAEYLPAFAWAVMAGIAIVALISYFIQL